MAKKKVEEKVVEENGMVLTDTGKYEVNAPIIQINADTNDSGASFLTLHLQVNDEMKTVRLGREDYDSKSNSWKSTEESEKFADDTIVSIFGEDYDFEKVYDLAIEDADLDRKPDEDGNEPESELEKLITEDTTITVYYDKENDKVFTKNFKGRTVYAKFEKKGLKGKGTVVGIDCSGNYINLEFKIDDSDNIYAARSSVKEFIRGKRKLDLFNPTKFVRGVESMLKVTGTLDPNKLGGAEIRYVTDTFGSHVFVDLSEVKLKGNGVEDLVDKWDDFDDTTSGMSEVQKQKAILEEYYDEIVAQFPNYKDAIDKKLSK